MNTKKISLFIIPLILVAQANLFGMKKMKNENFMGLKRDMEKGYKEGVADGKRKVLRQIKSSIELYIKEIELKQKSFTHISCLNLLVNNAKILRKIPMYNDFTKNRVEAAQANKKLTKAPRIISGRIGTYQISSGMTAEKDIKEFLEEFYTNNFDNIDNKIAEKYKELSTFLPKIIITLKQGRFLYEEIQKSSDLINKLEIPKQITRNSFYKGTKDYIKRLLSVISTNQEYYEKDLKQLQKHLPPKKEPKLK